MSGKLQKMFLKSRKIFQNFRETIIKASGKNYNVTKVFIKIALFKKTFLNL